MIPRPLIAPVAIAAAVCAGAAMLLVEPPVKALARARGERRDLEAALAGSDGLTELVPAMMKELERVDARMARIAELGAPALDQTGLHARLNDLATRAGVSIQSLDPLSDLGGSNARSGLTTCGYRIAAVGRFHDVAAFLASIQHELGYATIRQGRLSTLAVPNVEAPGREADGEPLVSLLVETEHVAIDCKPAEPATTEASR